MRIKAIIFITMMLVPAFAVAEDVIFIGNNQIIETQLTRREVQNIFLGKKMEWHDGSMIDFAILKVGATHDGFLKRYLKKSAFQFKSYWKKQVFTGKGRFPKSFHSDEEMIKFVGGTIGAIGYVSSDANLANVKTIRIK